MWPSSPALALLFLSLLSDRLIQASIYSNPFHSPFSKLLVWACESLTSGRPGTEMPKPSPCP